MLTSADLTGMKETADLALPETAMLERATLVSDGMGGNTEAWATVAEEVACRLDPPGNARLDQWSEKIQNRAVFILNVAAGTDIAGGDQATIGGTIYWVIGLLSGSWEITRRAVVVQAPDAEIYVEEGGATPA